jgi:cytidyltransferase-like protein
MKLVLSALLLMTSMFLNADPKRVYIDAVADLMHPGHIALFKKAKEQGDYLIVGIHSDEDVAQYKRIPILTTEERAYTVAACRYVDEVILNAPLHIDEAYIREHQIDLVIHGDDISQEKCQQWYGVPMRMGIFKLVPYTEGISTTYIIHRIVSLYGTQK